MSSKSDVIKPASASNIRVAMNAANEMGLPLTHFVTINFNHTVCLPEQCLDAFRSLCNNRFAKWVTRERVRASWQPSQPAYVWVFENPDGVLHVHWAVHIPTGAEPDFLRRMPIWLQTVTGGPVEAAALDIRPVDDISRLSLYFLKGADTRYTTFANILHVPQGTTEGRRMGVSRALNRTARKAAGINGQRRRGRNRAFYQRTQGDSAERSIAGA